MTNVERVRAAVLKNMVSSRYIKAAKAAGFSFDDPIVEKETFGSGVKVTIWFKCVCGRYEKLNMTYEGSSIEWAKQPYLEYLCDVGAILHLNFNSFGRDHLLEDGYSVQQTDEISEKYLAALGC